MGWVSEVPRVGEWGVGAGRSPGHTILQGCVVRQPGDHTQGEGQEAAASAGIDPGRVPVRFAIVEEGLILGRGPQSVRATRSTATPGSPKSRVHPATLPTEGQPTPTPPSAGLAYKCSGSWEEPGGPWGTLGDPGKSLGDPGGAWGILGRA